MQQTDLEGIHAKERLIAEGDPLGTVLTAKLRKINLKWYINRQETVLKIQYTKLSEILKLKQIT